MLNIKVTTKLVWVTHQIDIENKSGGKKNAEFKGIT